MSIEDQLRQAIDEHVAEISTPPDRWTEIEATAAAARRRTVTRRRAFASLALAAAIIVGVATVAVVHGMSTNKVVVKPSTRGNHAPTTAHHVSATTAPPPTAPTTLPPTPTTASPKGAVAPLTSIASTPTATLPPRIAFPYQPMWPFRTEAEAIAWQSESGSGGHQPWHLDAGQTALNFTQGYLGFTDIDKVVNVRIDGTEAHVTVGMQPNPGVTTTAAVIHEARFGAGADAPWEVVGTEDTNFSLTQPAYGSTATSPMTVGGRITGVDENISVRVLQPSTTGPIGQACCVPAGNVDTPWTIDVSYSGATDPVLTVVAVTGGHIAGYERFTITAVRLGG